MSGIYGVLDFEEPSIETGVMDRMKKAISHRGPDGSHTWMGQHLGLGQLRLNITPESSFETLPLVDNELVLIGDYRIDNRQELITDLGIGKTGTEVITDADILIKAYRKWGEKCASRIIGDYVFVIWDKNKKELFCVRDFIGTKVLVYFSKSNRLVFASEIKSIIASGAISRELNRNAVYDYLFFFSYDLKTTFFKDINHLPPAHFMKVNSSGVRIERYYQFPTESLLRLGSNEEYCEALLDVFSRSVLDRARSKNPIGVMLSGGLDSSSIISLLASSNKDKKVDLFAASSVLPEGYSGPEKDERKYIKAVLDKYRNIPHENVVPPESILGKELISEFETCETPVNAFYYMDNLLIQALRKNRTSLIFHGLPGDGIVTLQGNKVYTHLALEGKMKKILQIATMQSKVEETSMAKIIARYLLLPFARYTLPPNKLLRSNMELSNRSADNIISLFCLDKKQVGDKDIIEKYLNRIKKERREYSLRELHGLSKLNTRFYKNFTIEEIYNKQGFNQYDTVFPFLDRRLIEFMQTIPADKLLMDGWKRGFIRKTMDGLLPREVQWRRDKMPFSPSYKLLYHAEFDNIKDFYLKLNRTSEVWSVFDRNNILKSIEGQKSGIRVQGQNNILILGKIFMVSRFINHFFS